MSGSRATPAPTSVIAASRCGTRRASSSAASACPKSAATSASADPSATACSWPRASRSMPCTWACRARGRGETNLPPQRGVRAGEECLPLVVLDHLRRAHLGLVGIAAELAQGAALAQKIPALVELDIDRRQSSALGVGHVALGVELLLL